jgi:hypothetical protein
MLIHKRIRKTSSIVLDSSVIPSGFLAIALVLLAPERGTLPGPDVTYSPVCPKRTI